ncbi:MAG TPA: hypothetical protein VHC67_00400 [Gaiellaceae bacterium]|nr:hypothetical protein [Gaiellaceae bacterium]
MVARSLATVGAAVMGRRMFSGGSGQWVFANGTLFTFVTGGVSIGTQCLQEGLPARGSSRAST